MKFTETPIPGAWLIEIEPAVDERGHFARTFCREEFAARGLVAEFSQCSLSWNARRGTLRGMHYQVAPHAETKLVQCVRGALFDAIVDLRPDSPAYRRWHGVDLWSDPGDPRGPRRLLYVPEMVAHGYLTMRDDTEVQYQIAGRYAPECARGVRWDDPAIGVRWPAAPQVRSQRDGEIADLPG